MDGGVLGVLPGVIGTLQATEAIKLLAGIGEPLLGRLLHYDALSAEFRTFKLQPDPQCPVCGENPTITAPQELPGYCSSPEPAEIPSITVMELDEKITAGTNPAILDVRQPEERAACKIDGTLAIPLGELPDRLSELPATGELYVHCKSGMRSAKAVGILIEAGFGERAINVEGGIDAWREQIDPSLPVA